MFCEIGQVWRLKYDYRHCWGNLRNGDKIIISGLPPINGNESVLLITTSEGSTLECWYMTFIKDFELISNIG